MRTTPGGPFLVGFLVVSMLAFGVNSAKADTVGLRGGGSITGDVILTLNILGSPEVVTTSPWQLSSTVVPFGAPSPTWTANNILAPFFGDLNGPGGPYFIFALTNNTLDMNRPRWRCWGIGLAGAGLLRRRVAA